MNASEHPSHQGYEPPPFKDTKPEFTTNHGEPENRLNDGILQNASEFTSANAMRSYVNNIPRPARAI